MTIGIDATRANHDQRTGVEAYAFHVIEEMKTLIPSDVRVVLYSDRPLSGALANIPENWESKVLWWPPRRLWTQLRLSFEMLMHAPDVLFVPAHVPPVIHPKKTVMTVHDVAALRFPETYQWFERWYSVWSARRAVSTLWRVIVPSAFTKKELVHFFGHEHIRALSHTRQRGAYRSVYITDKEKQTTFGHVRVISLGCDQSVYGQAIDPARVAAVKETYAITKPYILTIGRLEEKKNTWRLVKAFDQLRETYRDLDVQLVLAGKPGYGFRRVAQSINESRFRNDIIKTGFVDDADIGALLAGASVFVFPSIYEGFGLPVLEAMAAGIPVITSRETSLEEVAGEAALFVDPFHVHDIAKKIHQVLADSQLQKKLIEKGKQHVPLFSWRRTAQETVRLLME